MIEQSTECEVFEVFAWGHGFVGARANLAEANRLAKEYEGARIITFQGGEFRVVAEVGRYLTVRARGLGS